VFLSEDSFGCRYKPNVLLFGHREAWDWEQTGLPSPVYQRLISTHALQLDEESGRPIDFNASLHQCHQKINSEELSAQIDGSCGLSKEFLSNILDKGRGGAYELRNRAT